MSGVIYKHVRKRIALAPAMLLSCVWLLGLLFGLVVVFTSRGYISSLVWKIVPLVVSAPVKLLFALLPFLLSAFAVSSNRYGWLFSICGVKAACFSIFCFLLCLCYGQAGWLACWLFMFFEISTLPCLFFYWLRHLSTQGDFPIHMRMIFFALLASIAIIDYRIVTPYAAKFGFF